jgi:putative transposase
MYHPTVLYHAFNHSNQHLTVFAQEYDYLLFLEKIREHPLPVADVLAYCLMPTHFHLMLLPKAIGCAVQARGLPPFNPNYQNLHGTFRTLLSSYTQKTNLRYGRRGSLFRSKTEYKPAYAEFVPEDWELQLDAPFTQYVPYLRICFDYIHDNPVKAGLAEVATDWRYSSARDYAGQRNGTLCNYELTRKLLGIDRG